MASALTIAHMEMRIADYHLVVEKWLTGSIDDHHLKQCGDVLLFYDAEGVEQAARIRERSQWNAAWK